MGVGKRALSEYFPRLVTALVTAPKKAKTACDYESFFCYTAAIEERSQIETLHSLEFHRTSMLCYGAAESPFDSVHNWARVEKHQTIRELRIE